MTPPTNNNVDELGAGAFPMTSAGKDFSPYGADLFGDPIKPDNRGLVAERFLFPPFTILDARQGEWQDRKRAWMSMGIEGEVGRESKLTYGIGLRKYHIDEGERVGVDGEPLEYTSVFDPVLCELAYRWWNPPGGLVVDPFSGGSVRGVVAAALGMRYWGCDLRPEQIEANWDQGRAILPDAVRVPISVSGKMLRQEFHPCIPDYIKNVCGGRCCEGGDAISVIVHPTEQAKFVKKGAEIVDGYIQPDDRGLCPFKSDDGFCRTHEDKPIGCASSPFTFTNKGTLIVRNRYRALGCYKCELGKRPAYISHRWSLDHILGAAESARICALAESGADIMPATMDAGIAGALADNHNRRNESTLKLPPPELEWVCGDALEVLAGPPADFIFSCPPYGDLEKYSDDPADLSNMEWHTFAAAYGRIILRAVSRLKPNRFACFVVGDFRDKRGFYRDFVSLTIKCFRDAGAQLYNEAILVTNIGSASMRVSKQFAAGRKLAKTHQNVLVFCKGDWRLAVKALGDSSAVLASSPAQS